MIPTRSKWRLAPLVPLFFASACGGDDLVLPQGPGPNLTVVNGDGQEGAPGLPLPEPLVVRLVDDEGIGIPNRAVLWVPGSGSGSVSPSTDMTDAQGYASAEWTLGPAEGPQRVTAQVPDIGSVTFTAANDGGGEAPAPDRVEALEGEAQSAPAGTPVPVRPAVRVLDEDGAPVAGYEVTFAVIRGGGTVSGATRTTDAAGIARVGGWTLGTVPGTNSLEARAGTLEGSPVTFTAEGTEPEPEPEPEPEVDRLVFVTPPTDAGVNESFRVEVALVDADGEVVPLSGIFIYLALFEDDEDNPSNDLLTGERFENTDDGVAAFDLAVERPGRYRLRALTDDLPELGPHGPEPYLFSEVFVIE